MADSAERELYNGLFGQNGCGYLSSSDGSKTVSCKAIHALSDTVFTTLTESECFGDIGSNTLSAGDTIYGIFTKIEIASGVIKYYK
jgi:hypothetical protein